MKKIYTFVIFIIVVLFLLLTITQCTKDNDNQEKKCITSFLEMYFTNEIPLATDAIPDLKIYKKYLTNDAYGSFYIDRIYPYELKGNIDNLEICDIEIGSIPNKDDTYHSYDVSFTLKNNENSKEKEDVEHIPHFYNFSYCNSEIKLDLFETKFNQILFKLNTY